MKIRELSTLIAQSLPEVGSTFTHPVPTKKDWQHIQQAASMARREHGLSLKLSTADGITTITRTLDDQMATRVIRGMAEGEVTHFDMDKYDTLRAYSAKEGIKVRKVVEVTKV